jgi:DNA polymerase III sliding clamp (beta) subunit (PCNA family)
MKPIPLPMAELKPALNGLSKIIPRRITLPIIGAVKIHRSNEGWIPLTGTDLDQFATVRLQQPAPGEPASILIPLDELVKSPRTPSSCR